MEYTIPKRPLVSKNLYNPDSECWKQQYLKVEDINNDITKGEGALLCIIDDGVGSNDELISKEIERWTYIQDQEDWQGPHSTTIASIIVGATLGIFPKMKIVSKQVVNPATGACSTKEVVSAIYSALESGIETLNISLGSNVPDPQLERALIDYCSNGRNLVSISAGNDGPYHNSSDYPANYAKNIKGVLSVAATSIDADGNVQIAAFSSRGIVSISAPGHGLKTMDHRNRLDFVSGTSYSSPIVGSALAAAKTLKEGITQDMILDALFSSASKIEGANKHDTGVGTISIYDFLLRVKYGTFIETQKEQKAYCRIKKLFKKIV